MRYSFPSNVFTAQATVRATQEKISSFISLFEEKSPRFFLAIDCMEWFFSFAFNFFCIWARVIFVQVERNAISYLSTCGNPVRKKNERQKSSWNRAVCFIDFKSFFAIIKWNEMNVMLSISEAISQLNQRHLWIAKEKILLKCAQCSLKCMNAMEIHMHESAIFLFRATNTTTFFPRSLLCFASLCMCDASLRVKGKRKEPMNGNNALKTVRSDARVQWAPFFNI